MARFEFWPLQISERAEYPGTAKVAPRHSTGGSTPHGAVWKSTPRMFIRHTPSLGTRTAFNKERETKAWISQSCTLVTVTGNVVRMARPGAPVLRTPLGAVPRALDDPALLGISHPASS